MVSRRLVKTDQLEIEGRAYTVEYFEATTARGTRRFTSETVLGPGDCIIVDGSSLGTLEWRVARLMPATIFSRILARAAA
jgi:hypothetical protein